MINNVLHTIKRYHMLAPGDRVLIGLSGGADSMALAFLLHSMQKEWEITVEAVHVNHGLRGAEAQRDAAFVTDWCAKQQMPLHVFERDVAGLAKAKGISIEQAGREVRYAIFGSFGKGVKIATAHHLNDSVETVLLHLARGTSIDGLTGIPPVRGNIIRPLTDCTRADIMAFCASNNIPFVIDSTNLQNDYARNRIRNEVIPVLQGVNPALEVSFRRFFQLAADDAACLNRQAQDAYVQACVNGTLDCAFVAALDPALQGRVLRSFLTDQCGIVPEQRHVALAQGVVCRGGKVQLTDCMGIKRYQNRLFSVPFSKKRAVSFQIVNKLTLTRKEFFNISKNEENHFNFCADCDKIKGNILVRSRLPGDQITLPGRNCTKKIKKYLHEMGVPEHLRSSVPVIADDLGVAGVAGYSCDRRVQPGEDTARFLLMEIGVTWDEE